MIPETLSRTVNSLTDLRLENISDEGGGSISSASTISSSSASNMDSKIYNLLKNNSLSLKKLSLYCCMGLAFLTIGDWCCHWRIYIVNCYVNIHAKLWWASCCWCCSIELFRNLIILPHWCTLVKRSYKSLHWSILVDSFIIQSVLEYCCKT